MDVSILLEYGWVLLVLIILEGILAADNALVLAIMVKHLPDDLRKKALFYGLAGAFVFRIGSLFIISFLVDIWQVQAIGALYLLFICFNHLWRKLISAKAEETAAAREKKESSFWMTVVKVELADIAFAVDSILAAIALAMTLPKTNLPTIGGLDGGQFIVIFLGGFTGVVIMRFAATYFVKLLKERPTLETAAFLIVGWVGVKLAVFTLAHPNVHIIPHIVPEHPIWKGIFWFVLVSLAVGGYVIGGKKKNVEGPAEQESIKKAENL